jgi:hypothetical protein
LRKWARVRAVSPLHDPEARKELADDLAWLWEEVRMALVALGKARAAIWRSPEKRKTASWGSSTPPSPGRGTGS